MHVFKVWAVKELRLWNRRLEASDVQARMNVALPTNTPGLVSRLPLVDDTSTLIDATGIVGPFSPIGTAWTPSEDVCVNP